MPVGLAAWGVAFVSILGGEIGRSGVVAEVNEIDLWVLSGCSALVVKIGQIADVVWSREKISHWNCRGLRFLLDATCPLKSAAPPSHASSTSLLLHERVTRIRPRRQRSDAQRILVSRELARQER